MTFLPIVARELRVAARRRGTYRMRLAMVWGALITGTSIFVATVGATAQQTGQYIFQGLSWLCLLYCLLSGRRWTADCLSEEKREGTLGLLFLTDLKGYDVVLGKLAAEGKNLARRELELTEDRFQQGTANNVEVVTAQDELARAEENYILAVSSHVDAKFGLARAMGDTEKNRVELMGNP